MKYITPIVFLFNYFTIFFICYIVKDLTSIQSYIGFFIQYFLLGLSFLLYLIRIYKPKNPLYRLKTIKINFKFYFSYQILFLIYTLFASFAIPQYIFLLNQSYSSIIFSNSYIAYLCSTIILSIFKLKLLHTHYKEENEFVPYYIV